VLDASSVVRIRGGDGDVVGAGFLVGEDTVLTCAHVVSSFLGRRDHSPDGSVARPTLLSMQGKGPIPPGASLEAARAEALECFPRRRARQTGVWKRGYPYEVSGDPAEAAGFQFLWPSPRVVVGQVTPPKLLTQPCEHGIAEPPCARIPPLGCPYFAHIIASMTDTRRELERLLEMYRRMSHEAAEARRAFEALILDPAADPAEIEAIRVRAAELDREVAQQARRLTHRRRGEAARSTGASMYVTYRPPDLVGEAGGARRDQVGAALDLLGAPARGGELALATGAVGGTSLSTLELIQLRRDEQRQWLRAHDLARRGSLPRPWYVVPALSSLTLAAAPGTYGLSTWPLSDRVITAAAPRLWAAQAAANVARAAAGAPDRESALRPLLGRLARGAAWGRWVWSGEATMAQIAEEADREARQLALRHADMAADAVDRLVQLADGDPSVPLWGLGRPRTAASR
jgi:hypothetical protein